MIAGRLLVKAHLESLMAGRFEDFERQLQPTFRYRHLSAFLGEGPTQARRWRNVMFSIYRHWDFEIEDDHDDGENVVVRFHFSASDPVEPEHSPAVYESVAVLQYEVQDGRLAWCNALHLDYEEREDGELPVRARR
jgi:hypothetical protein